MFSNTEATSDPGSFTKQNKKMLKVRLSGTSGYFYAKQGSMVAYQGNVDFAQAAVLWSTSLTSGIRKTAKASAMIGRGSGEAYQLSLSGQGFVVVQASEGHPIPRA